ncbi:MAG: O-antigen ligase family protein, partial [Bacteroidota bacterium]
WKNILVTLDQPRFQVKVYLDYVLWVAITWIGFVFIVGSFIDPDLFFRATHGGEVQRLGGFLINPNELGMLLSVGVGAMYLNLMRRGKFSFWYAFSWIVIVAALGMTQSRSSMISFALVSGYFLFLSGNLKLIIPSMVIGAAVAPVIFFTIFVKEGDVGEVASMTGRLPFWKDLLTYAFPDRPVFGYGFMRIHYLDKFPSIHAYPGAMTHNTFMQVLMNLGVIGATNNFAQMLFTIRAVFRQQDYWLTHTFPAVFFGIFINSLTEFGIFGDANYGIQWWLFLIFSNVLFVNPKPMLARHAPVYSPHAPR